MPEEAAASRQAAREQLREAWTEEGVLSCPSCDASEVEWHDEDGKVLLECRHCHYTDDRPFEA